jgi:hypothetical protein
MVKFRGKPKRKKSVEELAAQPHVYTSSYRPSLFKRAARLTRIQLLAVGIFVLIVLVVIGIILYNTRGPGSNQGRGKVVSQAEGFRLRLDELEGNPPAGGASKHDRATYYRLLSVSKADVEDYKGAIEAFTTGEQIDTASFDYIDYLNLARYYHELKDKTSAAVALDKAIAALPAEDNIDVGYVRADQIKAIEKTRREYGI